MKRFSTTAIFPTFLTFLVLTAHVRADDDAPEAYFDSDGVRIHYTVQGRGEPLILIHGYSANGASNWGMPGITAKLAENFSVVVIDNRGHGKSDKPHEPEQYGVKMVEDIVNLLDHLGHEKAHIVGYSMGGFITMKMLTLHPERMSSAIVGGAGWMQTDDPNASFMEELATSLEEGNGIAPLITALTPAGAPPMSKEAMDGMSRMLMATNDPLALAAVARGMKHLAVEKADLAKNEVRTLAVIGEVDPLKAGVDAMKDVMANLDVAVIEGANHMTAFTRPEFVEAMNAFFIDLCQCASLDTPVLIGVGD